MRSLTYLRLSWLLRVVDGGEDEGSPFKRHSFEFPAARSNAHSAASRHRSLTLAPRQPLVGESRMRTSYTAPQLSQGSNFVVGANIQTPHDCIKKAEISLRDHLQFAQTNLLTLNLLL